ncbi:MAG TPA: TIM barrel protein, partial [Vicinamibacteria bacterium]|nr:TIM barrel protein [Vicinamibacteria bacterium]
LDRRSFLAVAGAALAGAAAGRASQPRATAGARIRLGAPVTAPGDDPDTLARSHRAKGYRAGYCPPIRLDDRERLRATVEAFARHDVAIAEVGRWVNLLDPDPEARKKNLATVTEGLALAEAVGARCCVDIAGSFSATSWFGPHPENLSERFFDAAVENARLVLDAVKPARTTFCYEMMAWSLPDSPEACLRMLKAVDRKAFAVHLDPCNLVNSPDRYYRSSDLVRECYAKLGRHVASVHVKDLAWDVEMAVHFREVRTGQGSIDHGAWLAEHARVCPDVPLMLEHLSAEAEYDAARDHVRATGERLGLRFE